MNPAKVGFHVGVTCPGCGGEVELQENFFSLECAHCGSVLRVDYPESPSVFIIKGRKRKRQCRFQIDRYLKQRDLPLTRSDFSIRKIYYPYWKVDAIRLSFREQKVVSSNRREYDSGDLIFRGIGVTLSNAASARSEKVVEERKIKVTLSSYTATQTAGPDVPGIPASIGLRTGYIKALPLSAEMAEDDCEYFPVVATWDQIQANMIRSTARRAGLESSPGARARNELFRLTGSVIYFPYILATSDTASDTDFFVVDGVSGRVVFAGPVPNLSGSGKLTTQSLLQFGQLGVDFHRCLNCGMDLPAARSAIYICKNCQSVIALDKNIPLTEGIRAAVSHRSGSGRMFPFWSFDVAPDVLGGSFSSALPERMPGHLLIPAFRISNFEAMYRLSCRMTAGYSEFMFQPLDNHDRRFQSVDIGLTEAIALGEIILFRGAVAANPSLIRDRVSLQPSQTGIVFVPFHPRQYFYVDSAIGSITFEKSLIG